MMRPGEEKIVARRLREVLSASAGKGGDDESRRSV